ncbi:hypothetical protein PoB_001795300 [Plakobranchus ocellatus]|uniref:Uncharacterized protein n=1 Tax=Plakobranchus ocellatus TaxID=259542 RepID=A0AAV3ZAG8_9GAST|nr:hypothetical protein PoB_001795300 [Plakobranchus ocellatus]
MSVIDQRNEELVFGSCRLTYQSAPHQSNLRCRLCLVLTLHESVMMVFRESAEILGYGSEEEFPRFPRFRWLPRLELNKRAMIRGVLRNENSTTCGRDDNFIDLR